MRHEKGGYEHFMLKEMHEQPKAVKDTLTPRIKNGDVVIEELGMTDEGDPRDPQNLYRCLRFWYTTPV